MTDDGFRYDVAAIDEMKAAVNGLYDTWLKLASDLTVAQGRNKLMPVDAKATVAAAVHRWLREMGRADRAATIRDQLP